MRFLILSLIHLLPFLPTLTLAIPALPPSEMTVPTSTNIEPRQDASTPPLGGQCYNNPNVIAGS